MNEPAAYRLKNTIKNKISNISTFPNGYAFILSLVDDVSEEFSEVRKVSAHNYVIIYRYYEDIDIAIITHIFHQSQDYGKIFQR